MILRHQTRHVHKTICEHVRTSLDTLGWFDNPPFGATPVTFMEIQPEENGMAPEPNTVAVTLGDETPIIEAEMGAGLVEQTVDLFIDVYGEDLSTSVALSSDVRDALTWLETPLLDYTSDPDGTDSGAMLCFDDVFVDTPPAAVGRVDKRAWRVVNAQVRVEFLH